MRSASVFEQLRADHRRVMRDIVPLERMAGRAGTPVASRPHRTKAAAARSGRAAVPWSGLRLLLDTFARQFDTHMVAEDEVLFPMLARALPETLERLETLKLEHQELRGMLESLERLLEQPASAERDDQLAVQTCDFVDLLRIHVRKEEAVVFRVAERVLKPADLQEVAIRMERGATARTRRDRGNPKGKHS